MTERLLQFIWQHQYFTKHSLATTSGEALEILSPGLLNHHQGPDFSNARIRIDQIIFAGHIEVHCLASDWVKHNHINDAHYANVILHVVWEDDAHIRNHHNKLLPALELKTLVPKILLRRYEQLMNKTSTIACARFLPALSALGWAKWKESLAVERLIQKANNVIEAWQQTNAHWEETFWRSLAYNFGLKLNADLFLQIAKTVSVNILAKHKNQIHQLESLLLGQGNLLHGHFTEAYPIMLQKEYIFLQKKYTLQPILLQPNFLRMRPVAFPTIRLAQMASLIHRSSHLFTTIKELQTVEEVKQLFAVTANDYWNDHYVLDKQAHYQVKQIGEQTLNSILINTVIPALFAYGQYYQIQAYKEKALYWLHQLKAEQNAIVKVFINHHITCTTALDSQAILQLNNQYCKLKKCLQCAVGSQILKPTI